MKNKEEKIIELEAEIGELILALKIANAGWDSEKLELEQTKAKLGRETIRLNDKLEAEKEFLNGEIARKEAEINRVKTAWQEKYNRSEVRRKEAEAEAKKIQADWDKEESEKEKLEAENKILKADKEREKDEIKELEETIKGLQPSYAYQLADKFGIIKLKNTAVNIAVIVGLLAIVYALSLVLKYIAKPAWLNLAGFFPKSKKPKVITVEQEEEEAEENIFEVEAKPKLSKKVKVLRSNTKVKPKSKTK